MRFTPVQRDVLARMGDGWTLRGYWLLGSGPHYGEWELRKDGEASRHVAAVTVDSLQRHAAITLEQDGIWNRIGRLA